MPNDKPKNPPAFPTKREALDPRATGWMMQEGMTLRDYFAAQFAAAIIPLKVKLMSTGNYVGAEAEAMVAKAAYLQADAMLIERSK